MTDHRSKDAQRRRHERAMKKMRTHEEEKQLKRNARRKAQAKQSRRRPRSEEMDEDAAGFEKIRRSEPVLPTRNEEREAWLQRVREAVEEGDRIREVPVDPENRVAAKGDRRPAVVLSVMQGRVRVLDLDDHVERDARLPNALTRVQQSEVAVGDEVVVEVDGVSSEVDVCVRAVLPRRSSLVRPDPGNPNRERVLAANIDRAVVVLSLRTPPLHPGLIDRYLVALERGGVEPVLCVNKMDLASDDDERERVARLLTTYERLGIASVATSAVRGEGIDSLRRQLVGRACVFTGHSGVGKSALLNALDGSSVRRTGSTSDASRRGRHTTTSSMLTWLPDDTRVIDTPGIRELGLWRMRRRELRDWFVEFVELADGCRFRDCLHVTEPRCAVRAAVESGEVAKRRYDSYVRILSTLDE